METSMKPTILSQLLIALAALSLAVTSVGAAEEPKAPFSSLSPDKATPPVREQAAEGQLNEEMPVGDNQQPEWTTRRRFATTRVYVSPPWEVELETWWNGRFPREGRSEHLFQEEVTVGLPYRFQFDVYENMTDLPHESFQRQGEAFEVRWAFADWGKIPLNPTIYTEWKSNERDPNAYEVILLFAEELAPRWHWAMNVFWEQEDSGTRATELGWSQAISYALIDQKLSAGIEMQFEHTTEKGSRSDPEIEFLVGPSLQWRPTPRTHLDLVPLIGTTSDAPRVEAFVVFGIELGAGSARKEAQAPVSTKSR